MATKRNLIRLTAHAEETAARAEAAKEAVRAAKSALKEARKTLKVAKKVAKQARRKFETARADSPRVKAVRRRSAKQAKKAPVSKSRPASHAVRSKTGRKTVSKPRLSPAAVAHAVIDRLAEAKRPERAANEGEASQAALASTLV